MRSSRMFAALVLFAAGPLGVPAEGSPPPSGVVWFDEDRAALPSVEGSAPSGTVVRSRTAGLDATGAVAALVAAADLAAGSPGERVVVAGGGATIELFDGQRLVVEAVEAAVRRPLDAVGEAPWVEWLGVVRDDNGAAMAQVSMTFAPQPAGGYVAAGSVMTNDGQVLITHVDGDSYQLDQLALSSDLPQGPDVAGASPETGSEGTPFEGEGVTPASHGGAHVDVIVAFGNGNPGDITTRIAAQITEANNAMATSGVGLRLNLLATPYVNYTQDP